MMQRKVGILFNDNELGERCLIRRVGRRDGEEEKRSKGQEKREEKRRKKGSRGEEMRVQEDGDEEKGARREERREGKRKEEQRNIKASAVIHFTVFTYRLPYNECRTIFQSGF